MSNYSLKVRCSLSRSPQLRQQQVVEADFGNVVYAVGSVVGVRFVGGDLGQPDRLGPLADGDDQDRVAGQGEAPAQRLGSKAPMQRPLRPISTACSSMLCAEMPKSMST